MPVDRHCKEEITYFGDIRTDPVTTEYAAGWERIFGEKEGCEDVHNS